jgi:hypothetical protein
VLRGRSRRGRSARRPVDLKPCHLAARRADVLVYAVVEHLVTRWFMIRAAARALQVGDLFCRHLQLLPSDCTTLGAVG